MGAGDCAMYRREDDIQHQMCFCMSELEEESYQRTNTPAAAVFVSSSIFQIVICAPRAPQSVFARCKPLQTDKRFFLFLCSTSRFSPVHAYCSGDIKMMRVLKDNDNLIIIYDNLDLLLFITDLALKKGFCRHRQLLLQGISTVTINILKPNLQSKMCYLCSYS